MLSMLIRSTDLVLSQRGLNPKWMYLSSNHWGNVVLVLPHHTKDASCQINRVNMTTDDVFLMYEA